MADRKPKRTLPDEAVPMLQLLYCQQEQLIHLLQRCAQELHALRKHKGEESDGAADEIRRVTR